MSLRAAVYARISQDEHGLEKGVQRQLEDARQAAAARGWTVVGEWTDNDVSAFSGAARPGYQALMAAAEAGEFDRIMVYQSSRLWRSRVERAEAMEVLMKARVSVAAVRGPELDLASASGRMVAGILGEFDTAESAIKSERVARASLQRAQEGRANGPVAYGWRRERIHDDAGRAVSFRDVEDPDTAKVVREIVDRIVAGDGVRAIADDLQRRGAPTPSGKPGVVWRHSTVRKLALRPANVGMRVHQGQVIGEAAWSAIVDRDTHDRVVAILSDPRRRRSRDGARRHLLSYGIGQCGVCGGVLRVRRAKSRNCATRVDVMYYCDANGCVGRRQDRVDDLVAAVVVERLSRPDAAAAFTPTDDKARGARDRADKMRRLLDQAADDYAEGIIDRQQLARITERLRPALDAAQAEADKAWRGHGLDHLEPLMEGRPAAAWARLDVTRRRAVLQALGVTVKIMPTKRGPGFEPADVHIAWAA